MLPRKGETIQTGGFVYSFAGMETGRHAPVPVRLSACTPACLYACLPARRHTGSSTGRHTGKQAGTLVCQRGHLPGNRPMCNK